MRMWGKGNPRSPFVTVCFLHKAKAERLLAARWKPSELEN